MNTERALLINELNEAKSDADLFFVAVVMLGACFALRGATLADSIGDMRRKLFDGDFQRFLEADLRTYWDHYRKDWCESITEVDRCG